MATKLTSFNKENLKDIRKDLNAALKAVQDKYGIVITVGGITFNEKHFTAKLTTLIEDGSVSSNVNPKWVVHFNRNAEFNLGLKKSDLGKEFKSGGETLKLVGSRGARLPLVAEVVGTDKFRAISVDLFKNATKQ